MTKNPNAETMPNEHYKNDSTTSSSHPDAGAPPGQQKTLYIGKLSSTVKEDLLQHICNSMCEGLVKSCKIIHDPTNPDPYAFVEFLTNPAAAQALLALNGRVIEGKAIKVNWATSPKNPNAQNGVGGKKKPKQALTDPSAELFVVFVGDLSPEIDNDTLKEAFSTFGTVTDCRVVTDLNTGKSKGYGFVTFASKAEAEKGIQEMNGVFLGNRHIRTNWATRKPGPVPSKPAPKLDYDDVFKQSSETNTTVYCGNLPNEALTEELLRGAFSPFGSILEIRVFKEKGYGFIRFGDKASACKAICEMHNKEVSGHPCKCAWGRESTDPNNQPHREGGGTPSHAATIGVRAESVELQSPQALGAVMSPATPTLVPMATPPAAPTMMPAVPAISASAGAVSLQDMSLPSGTPHFSSPQFATNISPSNPAFYPQVYYYASNGQLQQLQQIQVPQFAGAYMTSNGQMAFPAGSTQSPGGAGYGIQYLPTVTAPTINAPGVAAGTLPWQHAANAATAAAAAAGSQIPGLAIPPAAAAYAAALQNLQVSQLNQQHLAQAQAHPYLVANGIGSGPAGYIAPTALASHPSAQAQMGTIQGFPGV